MAPLVAQTNDTITGSWYDCGKPLRTFQQSCVTTAHYNSALWQHHTLLQLSVAAPHTAAEICGSTAHCCSYLWQHHTLLQ